MRGAVPVARRNILFDRRRLATGVSGVGAAMTLILLSQGLWGGAQIEPIGALRPPAAGPVDPAPATRGGRRYAVRGYRTKGEGNVAKTHAEEVLGRLRRIEGQVSGIRKMHQEGRYCIEVLDQIAAARAGLDAAALLILEDHVSSCVRDAADGDEGQTKTAEMLRAVRRFVRSV